jgi:DNA-directed RNA polymerase subunit M/transcription elongation factor TFIIS
MRDDIIGMFNQYFNKKDSKSIENNIYSIVFNNSDDDDVNLEKYQHITYNILSILKRYKESKEIVKSAVGGARSVTDLEDSMYMTHKQLKENQKMRDEYITSPVDVEEGVMQCNKCGSMRTFSTQKQVRSADEGFSTFCMCANCGAKWRIN